MFVLLPRSMPSDLFHLTSSLVCEIYQIANLLSTGFFTVVNAVSRNSRGDRFLHRMRGLKSRPIGIIFSHNSGHL